MTSNRPVLLSSAIGYDASGRVEDLAVEMGREVTSIAIGLFIHSFRSLIVEIFSPRMLVFTKKY